MNEEEQKKEEKKDVAVYMLLFISLLIHSQTRLPLQTRMYGLL